MKSKTDQKKLKNGPEKDPRGRKPKKGVLRRPRLHIPEDLQAKFDAYTPEELSALMGMALRTLTPTSTLGAETSTILLPESSPHRTRTVCWVSQSGPTIQLSFPEKLEPFRVLITSLNFSWNGTLGVWERDCPMDRQADVMASTAHNILQAGFRVGLRHTAVQDMVISGTFNSENPCRVTVMNRGPRKNYFVLSWPKNKDLYDKAMRITAAKYADGSVLVPPEHHLEVEDFAEMHGFSFSPAARAVADQFREVLENALLVQSPKAARKLLQQQQEVNGVDPSLLDD